MAGKLVLATGGCRSGKSSFALEYVEREGGQKVFVATAPVLDAEMAERVARHRAERRGRGWRTVEEQTALPRVLAEADPAASILVDCLTLWIGNLMYTGERSGRFPGEDEVAALAGELAAAARNRWGLTLMVTNEVGWGAVPDNAQARLFRDLAGRANQVLAAAADEVYLLVCGLSKRMK